MSIDVAALRALVDEHIQRAEREAADPEDPTGGDFAAGVAVGLRRVQRWLDEHAAPAQESEPLPTRKPKVHLDPFLDDLTQESDVPKALREEWRSFMTALRDETEQRLAEAERRAERAERELREVLADEQYDNMVAESLVVCDALGIDTESDYHLPTAAREMRERAERAERELREERLRASDAGHDLAQVVERLPEVVRKAQSRALRRAAEEGCGECTLLYQLADRVERGEEEV